MEKRQTQKKLLGTGNPKLRPLKDVGSVFWWGMINIMPVTTLTVHTCMHSHTCCLAVLWIWWGWPIGHWNNSYVQLANNWSQKNEPITSTNENDPKSTLFSNSGALLSSMAHYLLRASHVDLKSSVAKKPATLWLAVLLRSTAPPDLDKLQADHCKHIKWLALGHTRHNKFFGYKLQTAAFAIMYHRIYWLVKILVVKPQACNKCLLHFC